MLEYWQVAELLAPLAVNPKDRALLEPTHPPSRATISKSNRLMP